MIIGISGKISSGKDTVANIITCLDCWYNQYGKNLVEYEGHTDIQFVEHILNNYIEIGHTSWTIKKFAGKLKQVLSILFDCDVKDFENIDFKNSLLPEEWQKTNVTQKGGLTYRHAIQRIGTEVFQYNWDPNTWIISLFNSYQPRCAEYPKGNYMNTCSICKEVIFGCDKLCYICQKCWDKYLYPNWIISDVRFLKEINTVKERGGYLIKVKRNVEIQNHSTETEMDEYTQWDWVIDNNSDYENLIRQVKHIMIELNLLKLN